MISTYTSNCTEALVNLLASHIQNHPPNDPMAADWIIVNSPSMQRWITHRISEVVGISSNRSNGICANIDFPFPASVIEQLLTAANPALPADHSERWSKENLMWAIATTMPAHIDSTPFASLRGFYDGHGTMTGRQLGLYRELADLFDRYHLYRPELIVSWAQPDARQAGLFGRIPETLAWQRILWQALRAQLGPSPTERLVEAQRFFQNHSAALNTLPNPLRFFGFASLPPAYLKLLATVSASIDIHLYLLSPTPHYWAEMGASPAQQNDALPNALHPLLASLGRGQRDLQMGIQTACDGHELSPTSLFVDPAEQHEPASLLQQLQSDLLHLVSLPRAADKAVTLSPNDKSMQFHACHGPARQVEVLRDALLRLLDHSAAQGAPIQPRDILILTPDIDCFAPIIDAVFSEGADHPQPSGGPGQEGPNWGDSGGPRLPVRIADRTAAHDNPFTKALLGLLHLSQSRFAISEVLDFIDLPAVRARFELTSDDMLLIRKWCVDAGIFWGIDGAHRNAFGQPDDTVHTWRHGLDRLLLGVAMTDADDTMLEGVVPCDDMEGRRTALLGQLMELWTKLSDAQRDFGQPRTPSQWGEALRHHLDQLVLPDDENVWLLRALHTELESISSLESPTDPPMLDGSAINRLLKDRFSQRGGSAGRETGAITVCALLPMRAIPAKVICLLGMDEEVYPRKNTGFGFDLTHLKPRIGDRNPSVEDRSLLLEALLCARENLIVLYSGRDIHSNEVIEPAVPVGELLETIEKSVLPPAGHSSVRDTISYAHPLQPFSPRNFQPASQSDNNLEPSFHRGHLAGAQALARGSTRWKPFFDGPLTSPEQTESTTIDLQQLARFFAAPPAFLLRNRLNIQPPRDEQALKDREQAQLDHLTNWALGNSMLQRRMRGEAQTDPRPQLQARGILQMGNLGLPSFNIAAQQTNAIVLAATATRSGETQTLPIDISLQNARVVGTLHDVGPQGRLHVQYGLLRPKHKIVQWLMHLAMTAAHPDPGYETILVGRHADKKKMDAQAIHIGPLGDEPTTRSATALATLQDLVALYQSGQTLPIPFFPAASFAYAKHLFSNADQLDQAMTKAEKKWASDDFHNKNAEDNDPANVLVYGAKCPLVQIATRQPTPFEFGPTAEAIWGPYLRVAK